MVTWFAVFADCWMALFTVGSGCLLIVLFIFFCVCVLLCFTCGFLFTCYGGLIYLVCDLMVLFGFIVCRLCFLLGFEACGCDCGLFDFLVCDGWFYLFCTCSVGYGLIIVWFIVGLCWRLFVGLYGSV